MSFSAHSDAVELRVSSSIAQDTLPRRFMKNISICALKNKLEMITGGSATSMKLNLMNNKDEFVCAMNGDTLTLDSFPIQDGMRIHVEDSAVKQFDFNSSNVDQKFELTDEEYQSKPDTLRSFLQKTKQGKYNPDEMRRLEEQKQQQHAQEQQHLASISLHSRCEVRRPGHPAIRGTVKFIGVTSFGAGTWVGVYVDEPMGKNDGSVKGVRYFECDDKYGLFVRPLCVHCGDFPEIFAEDMDDDDEM